MNDNPLQTVTRIGELTYWSKTGYIYFQGWHFAERPTPDDPEYQRYGLPNGWSGFWRGISALRLRETYLRWREWQDEEPPKAVWPDPMPEWMMKYIDPAYSFPDDEGEEWKHA